MADTTIPTASIEDKDEVEKEPTGRTRRWIQEVTLAEKEQDQWRKRGLRITKRYKDTRLQSFVDDNQLANVTRYNILWSNINTLQPSLFSKTPKPQVERRYKDTDPTGRVAATILERALDYSTKAYGFDDVMRSCVLDFLLVGRGQAWVRYVPYFETEFPRIPVTLNEEQGLLTDPQGQPVPQELVQQEENGALYIESDEAQEQVVYEEVRCDYVFWEDFLHSPGRVWDEVNWVARKIFLTKSELRERFGNKIAEEVPLDHKVRDPLFDSEEVGVEHEAFKKATVYEIWDKEERKVYWLHKKLEKFLDEEDDPLGLTDFFPCPKPLFATTTNDSLIPVADFSLYQDQARELDDLTSRISLLVQALKVSGVYDASFDGIKRILEEGAENKLIPVPDWPTFSQKGGFDGVMQFMPLEEVASTLQVLYQARSAVLQDIFQITGISDIIRGATSPTETATAQQLKGQFATLRLADRQREVQRFSRDLIALKGEIIAEQFYTDTIRLMTGAEFIDSPDVAMQFENAVELLRNDTLRAFRVDVETDSTLAIDEALEKEKRTELLGTIGRFFSNTLQTIQFAPETAPLMAQSLIFLMRGFKASRTLEAAAEQSMGAFIQRIQQQAQQPPQPSPEEQKAQMEMQMNQQTEQAKLQIEQFKAQTKSQLEQQKAFADAEIKQLRLQIEAKESQSSELLQVQKAQAEIALQREKLELETQLKAAELEAKMALKQQEIVEKQNVETIKALTSQESNGDNSSLPTTINLVTQPKAFKFSTAPDGSRVAEQIE